MDNKEKHFVLIHGAAHGAWCWYKLVPLLKSAGHRVTALDMAASGINLKRHAELNSYSDYAEPLMRFMEDLPEDDRVILIGHSMGGITISMAMEKFPNKIAVAVFITAFMPGPSLTVPAVIQQYHAQLESEIDNFQEFSNGEDKSPTSLSFGPNFLSKMMYQLSPPEDLALAKMLVRPIALHKEEVLIKETALSEENYGSVSRVYIIGEKDKVITEEFQRWMIGNNPPNDLKFIPDSDHMLMFSKPLQLSSFLLQISQQYH